MSLSHNYMYTCILYVSVSRPSLPVMVSVADEQGRLVLMGVDATYCVVDEVGHHSVHST